MHACAPTSFSCDTYICMHVTLWTSQCCGRFVSVLALLVIVSFMSFDCVHLENRHVAKRGVSSLVLDSEFNVLSNSQGYLRKK